MSYELKKMKESLEKNKQELEQLAKKSNKDEKFDSSQNALTTTLLIDAVSHLHMIVEIEKDKSSESKESKTKEQDVLNRKKEQAEMLKHFENENIDNEIKDVIKSFPEKYHGLVTLITAQIKYNYLESLKELKKIYCNSTVNLGLSEKDQVNLSPACGLLPKS